MQARLLNLSSRVVLKAIGEDRVADTPILKFHVTSSLLKNPVFQLLFDVSREPAGQGNCMLTTIMARLGRMSFLMFLHIPVGGCQDPSISACVAGRFPVARFGRRA